MNKHIKKFSDKLYENIGKGSVLLIKGRPTENGRRLYVTMINGYSEIKPGVIMTFLGDQIYRVVRRDGKYYGVKVDYQGEDGLKGVLNLKNVGRPSIVLNHNKTPYHWMTLKHLDIGSALRELGDRLYDHELILESDSTPSNTSPIDEVIISGLFKRLIGEKSIVLINSVEIYGNTRNPDDYISDLIATEEETINKSVARFYCNDYEWSLDYDISINADAVIDNTQMEDLIKLYESEIGESEENFIKHTGFSDMFGLSYDTSPSGFTVSINFTTDVDSHWSFTSGGYMSPPESDHLGTKIENNVSYVYYCDGTEVSIEGSNMSQYINQINKLIKDQEIPDIYRKIIGVNRITNVDNI